jgi:tryptophanyl-tRNA synthetase
MDLQDPTWKMSTSADSDAGVVRLLDPPDVVRKKLRAAVTDSGREVRRAPDKPGVTNLIEILSATTGEPPAAIEERLDGKGYGPLKSEVAEAVVALVEPIQRRFHELRGDETELRGILARGAAKAQAIAGATLALAHEHVGFVAP